MFPTADLVTLLKKSSMENCTFCAVGYVKIKGEGISISLQLQSQLNVTHHPEGIGGTIVDCC